MRWLLVGRNIGPGGIYNNLKRPPAGLGAGPTLLANTESLELGIVEPKIGNEVVAHHQGPSLCQDQILLGISSHARRNNDDRDSKFIVGQKLARRTQRFMVLGFGGIDSIEELLWFVGESF